jgi:hypothetical protein
MKSGGKACAGQIRIPPYDLCSLFQSLCARASYLHSQMFPRVRFGLCCRYAGLRKDCGLCDCFSALGGF